jgi:hypothetical protein
MVAHIESIQSKGGQPEYLENIQWRPRFSGYASFEESSKRIHTNQDGGSQGVREPDLRVNLAYHRCVEFPVPLFGSVCVVVDCLPYSDVRHFRQISWRF